MTETKTTTTKTATKAKAAVKESKLMKEETFLHEATGVSYVFQFPGTLAVQKIIDNSKNAFGNVVESTYNGLLMEQVIVSPQIDWDYWDENDGYQEVMNAADRFLGGLL